MLSEKRMDPNNGEFDSNPQNESNKKESSFSKFFSCCKKGNSNREDDEDNLSPEEEERRFKLAIDGWKKVKKVVLSLKLQKKDELAGEITSLNA